MAGKALTRVKKAFMEGYVMRQLTVIEAQLIEGACSTGFELNVEHLRHLCQGVQDGVEVRGLATGRD